MNFTLLPAPQYYQALIKALPKAKQRIIIHAMILAWTPGSEEFVPLLQAALKRGVRVQIVGDRFTRLHLDIWNRKNLGILPKQHGSWKHTHNINRQLALQGASLSYIGKIKPSNPFAGRCHSKIVVVDDQAFTFGGINFGDQDLHSDTPNFDYMLSANNKQLADYLDILVQTIAKDNASLPDYEHMLSPQTTLLFDGGKPQTSIIYDTACTIAASAKTIYYVSQWPPSGRLAALLNQKTNYCYYNRIGQGAFPQNVQTIIGKLRYPHMNRYRKAPYLHAKFLLTEEADGSRQLISGSNNFSWSGVQFGTKEIAVHSTDPTLWQTLYDYLQNTIA